MRTEKPRSGTTVKEMLAYVDDNGSLVSQRPDPLKKVEIKVDDIEISVPKMYRALQKIHYGEVQ